MRAAAGTGAVPSGSSMATAPEPQAKKREADTAIEELEVERLDRVIDVVDLVDALMDDATVRENGEPSTSSCAAVASLDIGALDAITT